MYRIGNIMEIETGDIFEIDVEIHDFISHIQTPFSVYSKNYREHLVRILVEVDKSKAHFFESKLFLASQKLEQVLDNGNIILSYTVTKEQELEELIKKWLPHMRVIEPLSLDEKIKSDIKRYLNS